MVWGLVSFLRSGYGKALVAVLVAGTVALGWNAFTGNPVETVKRISPDWTQERVRIDDDLTFTDSTGKATQSKKPEGAGDVEQTVNVDRPDTTSQRLFVEQTGSWFPDITGRPTAQVRGLSVGDVSGITVTNQSAPLFGIHLTDVMVGASYGTSLGLGLMVAYQPLQIWAFHFGPSVHVSDEVSLAASASVEIRESLHLVGSVTPGVVFEGTRSELHFGIAYRF